jgi:hypothetical protein
MGVSRRMIFPTSIGRQTVPMEKPSRFSFIALVVILAVVGMYFDRLRILFGF